jgi:hypothetical protein
LPIAEAARSKAWVFSRLLAGIAGSNPAGAWVSVSVSAVCYQVEVFAMGRSLVQRSPTECVVSECDLETSTLRRPGSARAVEP